MCGSHEEQWEVVTHNGPTSYRKFQVENDPGNVVKRTPCFTSPTPGWQATPDWGPFSGLHPGQQGLPEPQLPYTEHLPIPVTGACCLGATEKRRWVCANLDPLRTYKPHRRRQLCLHPLSLATPRSSPSWTVASWDTECDSSGTHNCLHAPSHVSPLLLGAPGNWV